VKQKTADIGICAAGSDHIIGNNGIFQSGYLYRSINNKTVYTASGCVAGVILVGDVSRDSRKFYIYGRCWTSISAAILNCQSAAITVSFIFGDRTVVNKGEK